MRVRVVVIHGGSPRIAEIRSVSIFNRVHLIGVGGLALLSAAACLPSQPTTSPEAPSYPARSHVIAEAPDLSQDAVLDRRRLACAVLASNPELAACEKSLIAQTFAAKRKRGR